MALHQTDISFYPGLHLIAYVQTDAIGNKYEENRERSPSVIHIFNSTVYIHIIPLHLISVGELRRTRRTCPLKFRNVRRNAKFRRTFCPTFLTISLLWIDLECCLNPCWKAEKLLTDHHRFFFSYADLQ